MTAAAWLAGGETRMSAPGACRIRGDLSAGQEFERCSDHSTLRQSRHRPSASPTRSKRLCLLVPEAVIGNMGTPRLLKFAAFPPPWFQMDALCDGVASRTVPQPSDKPSFRVPSCGNRPLCEEAKWVDWKFARLHLIPHRQCIAIRGSFRTRPDWL